MTTCPHCCTLNSNVRIKRMAQLRPKCDGRNIAIFTIASAGSRSPRRGRREDRLCNSVLSPHRHTASRRPGSNRRFYRFATVGNERPRAIGACQHGTPTPTGATRTPAAGSPQRCPCDKSATAGLNAFEPAATTASIAIIAATPTPWKPLSERSSANEPGAKRRTGTVTAPKSVTHSRTRTCQPWSPGHKALPLGPLSCGPFGYSR